MPTLRLLMSIPLTREPKKNEMNCITMANSETLSTTSTASLVTSPVTLPMVVAKSPIPIALTQPANAASIAVAAWTTGLTAAFGVRTTTCSMTRFGVSAFSWSATCFHGDAGTVGATMDWYRNGELGRPCSDIAGYADESDIPTYWSDVAPACAFDDTKLSFCF